MRIPPFEKLGMGYEAAKTLANEATAFWPAGEDGSRLWSALPRRGRFLTRKKPRLALAHRLYQPCCFSTKAGTLRPGVLHCGRCFLRSVSALRKAVLAHLLLARIALQVGDSAAAQKETDESLARLKRLQAPVLAFQAYCSQEQIAQASQRAQLRAPGVLEARKALEACAAGCKAKS